MLCSVVTPTYNRKESLRRTLDALAAQTLPLGLFEVVVVSDGSTDGTDELLAEYAKSTPLNLRWFTQKNAGPATARNVGIEKAKGDVIVFIDDDVELVPHCLERHLSHHEVDNKVVALGLLSPNPRWVSSEPVWIAWEHAKLQGIYAMFQTGAFAGSYAGYEHFYSGNASVRRKWLLQAGGFNTQFKRQGDVELAERLKRLCGVKFVWDFQADGLHHPVRTLASWLKIPSAYGALDAERVNSGTLEPERVDRILGERHGATRKLTQLCIAFPTMIEPLSTLLCKVASFLYSLGLRNMAFSALSAVYNARYTTVYLNGIHDNAPGKAAAQAS